MLTDTRHATVRAYDEMRRRGQPDRRAFEAAVRLFKLRFPTLPGDEARFVVADWITEALGQ